MRTVLIGDIHGCYDELIELCDRVGLVAEDRLLCLGDVVDRGPQPAEVIGFLRQRPNTLVLMGNHERKHVRGVFSFSQEITRLQLGDEYADAVQWMSALPYWHETADFIAAHAALSPAMTLETQREDVLAGTVSGERALEKELNGARWCDRYGGDKPVIVGHHVVTGLTPYIPECACRPPHGRSGRCGRARRRRCRWTGSLPGPRAVRARSSRLPGAAAHRSRRRRAGRR